jgi:hypothetical protein
MAPAFLATAAVGCTLWRLCAACPWERQPSGDLGTSLILSLRLEQTSLGPSRPRHRTLLEALLILTYITHRLSVVTLQHEWRSLRYLRMCPVHFHEPLRCYVLSSYDPRRLLRKPGFNVTTEPGSWREPCHTRRMFGRCT